MPILLKKPAKAVPAYMPVLGPSAEHRELIDAIGEAQAAVDKAKAAMKKAGEPVEAQKTRLAALQAVVDEMQGDPDAPLTLEAERYVATTGAKGVRRELKEGGLMKILAFVGEDTFLKIIDVPLGKLDDYLTKPQRDEVLTETRAKRLKLTVKKRAA